MIWAPWLQMCFLPWPLLAFLVSVSNIQVELKGSADPLLDVLLQIVERIETVRQHACLPNRLRDHQRCHIYVYLVWCEMGSTTL